MSRAPRVPVSFIGLEVHCQQNIFLSRFALHRRGFKQGSPPKLFCRCRCTRNRTRVHQYLARHLSTLTYLARTPEIQQLPRLRFGVQALWWYARASTTGLMFSAFFVDHYHPPSLETQEYMPARVFLLSPRPTRGETA